MIVCIVLLLGPLIYDINSYPELQSNFDYTDLTFYTGEMFNLLEFLVIMIYLISSLQYRNHKAITIFLLITGILLMLFSLYHRTEKIVATNNYAIASVFIIISLLPYFFSKLHSPEQEKFQTDPTFLVTSGFFVQFSLTLPSSILIQRLGISEVHICNMILLVNYSAYTFYFYTLLKGFQCQIELTK